MKHLLLIIISICWATIINAQSLLNIQNAPLDTVDCNLTCYSVKANFIKPKLTTSYTYSAIPFSPANTTTGTILNLGDDMFSSAIPLGFTFCFYNNTYNQAYISSNGHITFNSNYSNAACSFDTKKPMPFFNAKYPDNAIFCPFTDGNTLNSGTIKYATTGIAPFRKFIVSYISIPYFSCTAGNFTSSFQCILYETTNEIDVHITQKPTCNADTSNYINYSTIGIQSIGTNNYLTVAGKNASIWNAFNESWRFSPNGANAYSIAWFQGTTPLSGNADTISICDPFPKTIKAVLTINCPGFQVEDTIRLVKFIPKIDSVQITKTNCKNTATGTVKVFATSLFPPITYALNNNVFSSNNFFTNVPFGSNSVKIKDANGCIQTLTVTVGTNTTLQAKIDSFKNPICPNYNGFIAGSAIGGVPPYTYHWTNGDTGLMADSLGPGTYYFTVTDANGCKDSIVKTLVFDPLSLPEATSLLTKPTCLNASGQIDITVSGGTPPYSYSWSNGAITQDLSNLSAGTYTVTITDINGCLRLKSYTINDTLNMQANITGVQHTTCGLNNATAQVAVSNGMPPIQYLWNNGATTFNATNLAAGTQYVTVIDANGCTRSDTTSINSSLPIAIQFLPANAHCDSANGLINTLIFNSTGTVNYIWSNGANSNSIYHLAPTTYWLKVTDANNCEMIDTITLKDDGVPHLKVVKYINPVCKGDTNGLLVLDGFSGVAPYKYSFDNVNFSATAQLNNFAAGTYTIYIRDANSCVTDTIISFQETQEIKINNSVPDSVVCFNDSTASFSVWGSLGKLPYIWSFNKGAFSTDTFFNHLGAGIYTIQLKDANNCEAEKEVEVRGPFLPLQVSLEATDIPCFEDLTGTLTAEITGGWQPVKFKWSHINSLFTFLDKQKAGLYKITATDKFGCAVTAIDTIKQTYCCNSYLPNSFTPNGDHLNDVFKAITASDISEFSLKVFNRWGQEVFATKDYQKGWNGQINGMDAAMDTYFYLMYYRCPSSTETIIMKGDLLLLR